MEADGKAELRAAGFLRRAKVETVLDMRYAGQSFELPVSVRSLEPADFLPMFQRAHRERYGHGDPSRAVEVVNLRVKLVVDATHPRGSLKPTATPRSRQSTPLPVETSEVWFGDAVPKAVATPFFTREDLGAGMTIRGPAIVVQMDCTTVVAPRWRAEVDRFGNLVMTRASRR